MIMLHEFNSKHTISILQVIFRHFLIIVSSDMCLDLIEHFTYVLSLLALNTLSTLMQRFSIG